jgi:hypothetical protein
MSTRINIDTTQLNKKFKLILESVEYQMHCYWNNRQGWYLAVYDAETYDEDLEDNEAALIVGGLKMMPQRNLFKFVTDERLQLEGSVFCADFDPTATPAGEDVYVTLGNFGKDKRFRLVYFSKEEIAELTGG